MAVLNKWQRIDRVISGKPFGNGSAGDVTISADPNTRETALGTVDTTALTAGGTGIADGDVVMIHQTRGTGAGQWEINKVASGGGTVNLVMKKSLAYTYVAGAQIVSFPMNDVTTINAFTATAWNGSKGGLTIICGRTSIGTGGNLISSEKGFRGGSGHAGSGDTDFTGQAAEGTTGGPTNAKYTANGNGGGGGGTSSGETRNGAGGGGHANAGVTGTRPVSGSGGVGGAIAGVAALTTMVMGGGGGEQGFWGSWSTGEGEGGNGGGIVVLISKAVTLTNTIAVNGEAGEAFWSGGGGGAGGSVLVQCETAILGTGKITAALGAGGTGGDDGDGGAGSVGRIAVHHSDTVTGTTNPIFSDTTDDTLVESTSGGAFLLSQFV